MKDLLERLIGLATEWRAFSKEVNGWQCREWIDEHVRCYFATDSDHSSVTFCIQKRTKCFDTIQVSFHSEPIVNGFTMRSIKYVEAAIVVYTDELEKLKVEWDGRDKVQAEKEKQAKIEGLKRQLKELENNNV